MLTFLHYLLALLWPRPGAPQTPPPGTVPPGLVLWDLGRGWRMERYAVKTAGGVAYVCRRLVCPSRRKAWLQDRRGWMSPADRLACPN